MSLDWVSLARNYGYFRERTSFNGSGPHQKKREKVRISRKSPKIIKIKSSAREIKTR